MGPTSVPLLELAKKTNVCVWGGKGGGHERQFFSAVRVLLHKQPHSSCKVNCGWQWCEDAFAFLTAHVGIIIMTLQKVESALQGALG